MILEEYIAACEEKYGDIYDYSRVTDIEHGPILIMCKKHGAFFDFPYSHLHCNPCMKCMQENFPK